MGPKICVCPWLSTAFLEYIVQWGSYGNNGNLDLVTTNIVPIVEVDRRVHFACLEGPSGFQQPHSPLTPGPRGHHPEVFGVSLSSNSTSMGSGCPLICLILHLGLDYSPKSKDGEERSLRGFGSFDSGSPAKTEAPSPRHPWSPT